MRLVTKIVNNRKVAEIELTEQEERELDELRRDPRWRLWREYVAARAGIRKSLLFSRVLEGRKDYDPTGEVAFLAAVQELTELGGS